MLALVVRFDLESEASAPTFDALTRELVGEVAANEPGALVYAMHTVEGEPLARVLYEVYADEEALRVHQESPYLQAFLSARTPLLAAERAERLDVTAANGLDA